MKKVNLEEIHHEYEDLNLLYTRTGDAVRNEIEKLLSHEGISLGFPIQLRIKKWDSIVEKIESGRFQIKKSIKEFQDLVGLRIILLFKSDADRVCELIKNNFSELKTYNAGDKLQSDQFGYSSIHVIAKIPQEWTKVPSFKDLDNVNFEIQIRTLSQHMWAEVSNKFQYKQEENVPKELLRSIGRASALLEIVDLEFDRLTIERQVYKTDINNGEIEERDLDLNVDLLAATLDRMLPKNNKSGRENYASLLSDLISNNINTIGKLNQLIEKNLVNAIKEDQAIVSRKFSENRFASKYEKERAENGAFFTHEGLTRTMLLNRKK